MELKPVEHSQPLTYPTRREVLAGAVSFALLSLTRSSSVSADADAGVLSVAPIFEHGTGRGATGCVVISPPVFLSEEEGMQIIREELARHGIQLKDGVILGAVRVPQRMRKPGLEGWGEKDTAKGVFESRKRAKPLKLDGVDTEKKIAVEFVSKEDYFDMGGVQESYTSDALDDMETDEFGLPNRVYYYSSSQSYDFMGAAEFVAAQVKKQGKEPIYLGLFYDPQREDSRTTGEKTDLTELLKSLNKPRERIKDESKKLLRRQAQDFVTWLKKQKAIE